MIVGVVVAAQRRRRRRRHPRHDESIFGMSVASAHEMITENGIEQLRNDRQFSMNYDLWL